MKIALNNTQIAYSDHGIGLPVIFLHAFPLNRAMWDGEMAALLVGLGAGAPWVRAAVPTADISAGDIVSGTWQHHKATFDYVEDLLPSTPKILLTGGAVGVDRLRRSRARADHRELFRLAGELFGPGPADHLQDHAQFRQFRR